MTAKFNLYDFIASLIPGLVFLWTVEQLAKLGGWSSPFPSSGQLPETSMLVALGYVTGLMLQAVSERVTEKQVLFRIWGGFPSARWLLPDDPKFSASYKTRVLELIAERFKVKTEPDIPEHSHPAKKRELRLKKNQELFYLCYNAVDNLSPRPQIFNAQYGLFRCLLTMFALLACASLFLAVWKWSKLPDKRGLLVFLPPFFAGLAWLSYQRCTKRGEDFAKSIYDLFIASPAKSSSSEPK